MSHAKNYSNWPMFHGAIEKIIVACFMDQCTLKVILFFNSSLSSGKNKEYLTAVFKRWLKSCKEFLSENRTTLWCKVAKLWCHELCAVFGPPCIKLLTCAT